MISLCGIQIVAFHYLFPPIIATSGTNMAQVLKYRLNRSIQAKDGSFLYSRCLRKRVASSCPVVNRPRFKLLVSRNVPVVITPGFKVRAQFWPGFDCSGTGPAKTCLRPTADAVLVPPHPPCEPGGFPDKCGA
jgi:hypothetical protein